MNALIPSLKAAASGVALALLAGCASESKLPVTASGAVLSEKLAASPAASALTKLVKNLSGAQVLELIGPPTSTKPITAGELGGTIWSYRFPGTTETNMVIVATQNVPAVNPYTGQPMTRPEPVYQNMDVQKIDTLHLLMVDDRLVEWRVVRDEQKKFQ
jgi:hypothetical protein